MASTKTVAESIGERLEREADVWRAVSEELHEAELSILAASTNAFERLRQRLQVVAADGAVSVPPPAPELP